MSKENGFAPIRRGLWEHVRDGRMSPFEALAFIYICSQADTRTGVWKGSAGALVSELGFQPRTARDLLERMEHGGYIRRFCKPGERHCYPILIHKFPVTQGEHNGEVLDALSSTKQDGCLDLRYISCEVHGEVDGEVHGKVHASQRRSKNREKRIEKKTPAAKPAPPDPRHQPFVDFAFRAFEAQHGQKPSWQGKDWKALQNLLASNKSLGAEELQRRFENYLASTEAFTVSRGGSLAYFCTNADAFITGPIFAKGKNSGKPDINEAVAITMRGAAANARRPN